MNYADKANEHGEVLERNDSTFVQHTLQSLAEDVNVMNESLLNSANNGVSSEDSDKEVDELPLLERRELKIQRNHAHLETLGLNSTSNKKRKFQSRQSKSLTPEEATKRDQEPLFNSSINNKMHKRRNMLLNPHPLISNITDDLTEKYLYRDEQIKVLSALLDTACSCSQFHTPAPIFVSGPSGSGKTAILRDIIARKQASLTSSPQLLEAYVDASTLDEYSVTQTIKSIATKFESSAKTFINGRKDNTLVSDQDIEVDKFNVDGNGDEYDEKGDVLHASYALSSDVYTMVNALGHYLLRLFRSKFFGVLLLDNADGLLEIVQKSGSHDVSNMFSQLLHLPKILGLNLTIVVISRSVLLETSRTSMLALTKQSNTNIAECVKPYRVHFNAYRGREKLRKILGQPHLWNLIVGNEYCSSSVDTFSRDLKKVFLDTTVQSIGDLTNDLNMFIRFARMTWPRFTEPLSPKQITSTLNKLSVKIMSEEERHKKLLFHLVTNARNYAKTEMDKLFNVLDSYSVSKYHHVPTQNNTIADVPLFAKYMLLASFLCQVNKATKDKQLFSMQKNGRRNTRNLKQSSPHTVAFGTNSSSTDAMSTSGSRSFPLERMLSILTSLLKLNGLADKCNSIEESSMDVTTPSTSVFAQTLSHLQEIGFISTQPRCEVFEMAQLSDVKLHCTLTNSEAQTLAKSIDLDLNRYIT